MCTDNTYETYKLNKIHNTVKQLCNNIKENHSIAALNTYCHKFEEICFEISLKDAKKIFIQLVKYYFRHDLSLCIKQFNSIVGLMHIINNNEHIHFLIWSIYSKNLHLQNISRVSFSSFYIVLMRYTQLTKFEQKYLRKYSFKYLCYAQCYWDYNNFDFYKCIFPEYNEEVDALLLLSLIK